MFLFRSAVMRLGKKKEKDREIEKQCIDGISRLICSPKQSHPIPLRGKLISLNLCIFVLFSQLNELCAPNIYTVYIDGTEWTGVKFFQLSSQWQTHVKNFPVGLIGASLASADLC